MTQVGRALADLGVEHVAVYSPQTRERSERLFATLQDRLPEELRLAGIKTFEAANAWLKSHYIAEHNARFAVAPEQEGSAFVPDATEMWREILCIVEERTVAADNTVAWNGKSVCPFLRMWWLTLLCASEGCSGSPSRASRRRASRGLL